MSYTAFPFVPVTHAVEGLVPSPFFLTLWLSQEFSVLSLENFVSGELVIETNYCSALS